MPELIRTSSPTTEEEDRWTAYIRKKIQQGMVDVAAGKIIDGETAMQRIRKAIRSEA